MFRTSTTLGRAIACSRISFFLGVAGLVACTASIDGESSRSSPGAGQGGPGAGSGAGSGSTGGGAGTEEPGLGATPEEVAEACAQKQGELDVGLTRLRRLTRRELDNTVRDLLGVEAGAEDTIAPDERIGPFYSNAIAPITDLMVEQYQELAQRVATEAVSRMAEIAPCDLSTGTGGSCVNQFVTTFGARAYRRPLAPEEVAALTALYSFGEEAGGPAGGFSAVIEGALQSPHFLYHSDAGSEEAPTAAPVPLDAHALAARLSYFLWKSPPDEPLSAAASGGTLGDPAVRAAEVARMLDDPRAAQPIATFHSHWLGFSDLGEITKDPNVYPAYGVELARAMLDESAFFTAHVVLEGDGLLSTLLTSNLAFPQGRLFEVYGVPEPEGYVPGTPVELERTRRAGLLTQAAFLTRQAHGNQTSPVHRGILVRENVLCQPIDPPPNNVNASAPPPTEFTSTRERFEQHVADPTCAGCHTLIDPIGMGFEHYDGIGAYRETDGLGPVDAKGELIAVRDDLAGPYDGAVELAQRLAASAEVADCVARQWFRFALGRVESKSDACSIQEIQTGFSSSNANVRQLLADIALSDAFSHLRSTGGDAP